MKNFTRGLLCACLCTSLAYSQGALTPEILYYKFDGTGIGVPNLATNPPLGTDTAFMQGAVTQGDSGQCGGAIIGTGNSSTTDFMNTGWVTNLTGTPWTISFWTSNIGPSSTLFYIWGDATAGSLRCFTNGVAGPNNWILRGTMTDVLVTNAALVTPTMTTFVYDTSAGAVLGYVNGVLQTTVAQSAPVISSLSGPFKVNGYGSNVGLPAAGLMDEFRVYSRALNAAEIMDLYTLTSRDSVAISGCGSNFVSPSGNYTWTSDGTYQDTIPNSTCGDSILTIDLTLLPESTGSETVTSCTGNYISPSGNYTWVATGIYQDTVMNMFGCDSVITVDLTVYSIDTTVTLNGFTLTANDSTATFQWVMCDSAFTLLPGETNATFTPIVDGNYAVIINQSGCVDTSACQLVSGLGTQTNAAFKPQLFPNPTSGNVTVNLGVTCENLLVKITDVFGKVIQELSYAQTSSVMLDIPGASGLYFVELITENGDSRTLRVVKK